MKKIKYIFVMFSLFLVGVNTYAATSTTNDPLLFPKDNFTVETKVVQTPQGDKKITYKYYQAVPYVANPVDLDYQSMKVLVPIKVDGIDVDASKSPILMYLQIYAFLPWNIREAEREYRVVENLALAEGYVVIKAGVRNRTNKDEYGNYFGKAPSCIVDSKAAIRYIRHNKGILPGNSEWIITTGGSAGGGSSTILGTSGNSKLFEPYLKEIGAADERDDVFASASVSPMFDFQNGDMQYEWMWGNAAIGTTNAPMSQQWNYDEPSYLSKINPKKNTQYLTPEQKELSKKIAQPFNDYLKKLNLVGKDSFGMLNTNNYAEYILNYYVIPSANRYLTSLTAQQQKDYLSTRTWIKWDDKKGASFTWQDYIDYVGRKKGIPVFDDFESRSAEAGLFGDKLNDTRHFTEFTLNQVSGKTDSKVTPEVQKLVDMMNPMYFLDKNNTTIAKHWWIRHGTYEAGTSQTTIVNLTTLLENRGYNVNTKFFWDAGHMADLDTPDFIKWVDTITGYKVQTVTQNVGH